MHEIPPGVTRPATRRRFLDAPGRQVVVATIVLVLAMSGWFLQAQRAGHAEAVARAERDTRNLAHLLAEHAARSLDSIDETLRAVGRLRADVARGIYRSQASIHVNLRTLHGGSPLLDEIGWLDAHGERVATSRLMDAPRVSMARQEFFRLHAASAGDVLHVARPTRSNGETGWLIDFSRRLESLDGSFAGVAHGTLDGRRFVEVYAGLELAPGHEITLLRGDGPLLARWPHDGAPSFQPVDQGIVLRAAAGGRRSETYQEVSPVRRAAVIGSYAIVPRSAAQLIVDVNVLRAAALEPFWRAFAREAIELFLALAALIAGAAVLAVSLDRREALLTELAAANASAEAAEAAAARIARSEAELQRALDAEREMSAEQRRFISIASHEFRTPLSIIDGAAQRLLRRTAEGTDAAKLLARVRGGVTRMTEIIDRTLALSRVEQAPLELQGKIVDLVDLVRQACAQERARSPDFAVETALPAHPS
jgi:two-component system, cell cycle sensor histidine kinase PleC